MRVRKLLAVFLAVGYLADVHCRVACAGLPARASAAPAQEKSCHSEPEAPAKQESKACCMTDGCGEAVLPSPAPMLAPAAAHALPQIVPHAVAAVAASQALRSYRNHGPPRVPTDALPRPSQGPRAPPAVL